ncbi:hypothetical protein D3C87_1192440 [compost metagenome]
MTTRDKDSVTNRVAQPRAAVRMGKADIRSASSKKRAIDVLCGLPGYAGKQGELGSRLGYSVSEFSKLINNSDRDLHPEMIIQACIELAKENFGAKDRHTEVENPQKAAEFEARFKGTKVYDDFQAFPGPLKQVLRAMARANQELSQPKKRSDWVEDLKAIVPNWNKNHWEAVLTDDAEFPEYAAVRQKMGEIFGCDESLFHPEGLVRVGSEQADWMVIDRLILAKIKNPGTVRFKPMESDQAKRQVELYLMSIYDEIFSKLPRESQELLVRALLPLVQRYDAISDSSRRPSHLQAQEVAAKIAFQLPIVRDPIRPALTRLRREKLKMGEKLVADGCLVRDLARDIAAPPTEVAYLLLGIATEMHFPETFEKLFRYGRPKYKPFSLNGKWESSMRLSDVWTRPR